MARKRQYFFLLCLCFISLVPLAGCNLGDASAPGQGGYSFEVGTDGDIIAYSGSIISFPARRRNEFTFRNNATSQQHNWVLVDGGDQVAAQVAAAAATQPDYLPVDRTAILAVTPMLNGGESATIELPALDPGQYTYLCTFPGHYEQGMKGVLDVNTYN